LERRSEGPDVQTHSDYLIKREQQELEAALSASDARARRRHLELADAYTSRIDELKRREPAVEGSDSGRTDGILLKC
jgi:hypothetical protein